MMLIPPALEQATQHLVGCTLIDVNVKSGYVEFVFLGDVMRVIVRITKEFSYRVRGNSGGFNPNFDFRHPPSQGAADFVLSRGDRCDRASIDEHRFVIGLEVGSEVLIDLFESDFEPVEMIGMTGDRFESLVFHHVL